MVDLKEVDLGERAIYFGATKLSQGNVGSRMIAEALERRAKAAWSFLPMYVNANQVYEFESGGVCDIDSSERLSELVHSDLMADGAAAWILLDNISTLSNPIDGASISGITTPFSIGSELFQLLSKHMISVDSIHETFRFGGAYPFVGFITKLDKNLLAKIKTNRLSIEDWPHITDRITRIIVGAYDEEAYLVFELPAA